jgi:nucleotide-binding universal stress UspA family protein
MYERILVALDGSELAERVLSRVDVLARALGSTLILLRATTPPEKLVAEVSVGLEVAAPVLLDPTPLIEEEKQVVEADLATVAARLREAGLTVQTDDPQGPAAEAIVRRAGELGVDLIAMTTHGRTGLRRMIYGSVAEEVLRRSTCPILLVRVTEA